MARRPAAALLSIAALAVPLSFVTGGTATAATTTQTGSCIDGGGHVWQARTVWGAPSGGAQVADDSLGITSASGATTVDYFVATRDGSGTVVGTTSGNRSFDFDGGDSYLTVDPKDPPSAPGRSSVALYVGDGHGNCSIVFTQPAAAPVATPTATASPTATTRPTPSVSPTPTASTTPTASPTATASPTPSASPTATASASPTASPTPTASASPTLLPVAGLCSLTNQVLSIVGQGSSELAGGYNVSSELWNVNGYRYSQSMSVCSHDAWGVDVTADDSAGDGAVKAYPSMRKIYHDWSTTDFSKDPLLSSFPRLDTSFASSDPTSCSGCVYDTAFDVWLNGIGNGSANEVMIWTHNAGQQPFGTKVASGLQVAGHTWDLWSGNDDHYLAFVPTDTTHIASGTFDVKDFTDALVARSRIPSASRLGQISYGVETVSTGGVSRHWDFTRFDVADS